MMAIILLVLKYFTFFSIFINDMKKKLIYDRDILFLVLIGLFSAVKFNDLGNYYLGASGYLMPLLALYILEDYFKKSLIGFGDVKLMMGIGGLFRYSGVENIFKFYTMLYIFSGIVVLFLLFFKKLQKCEYIPFAPFIIVSYIFFNHFKIFFG